MAGNCGYGGNLLLHLGDRRHLIIILHHSLFCYNHFPALYNDVFLLRSWFCFPAGCLIVTRMIADYKCVVLRNSTSDPWNTRSLSSLPPYGRSCHPNFSINPSIIRRANNSNRLNSQDRIRRSKRNMSKKNIFPRA